MHRINIQGIPITSHQNSPAVCDVPFDSQVIDTDISDDNDDEDGVDRPIPNVQTAATTATSVSDNGHQSSVSFLASRSIIIMSMCWFQIVWGAVKLKLLGSTISIHLCLSFISLPTQ